MKKIIFLNSLNDLEIVLMNMKYHSTDGNFIYPDFKVTYVEFGKYLLEIKQ